MNSQSTMATDFKFHRYKDACKDCFEALLPLVEVLMMNFRHQWYF